MRKLQYKTKSPGPYIVMVNRDFTLHTLNFFEIFYVQLNFMKKKKIG